MTRRHQWILAIVLCVLTGCDGWHRSGDRVLVSKFLYETNLAEPRRFDVVVFKYPETPTRLGVPRNYIKRLLGLPGEILAIFFGQLFRVPAPDPGSPPHFDDLKNLTEPQKEILAKRLWMKVLLDSQYSRTRNCVMTESEREVMQQFLPKDLQKRLDEYDADPGKLSGLSDADRDLLAQQLWVSLLTDDQNYTAHQLDSKKETRILKALRRPFDFTHTNDDRARLMFRLGKFEPVRKPPDVMMAMRRIVYDNDFPAADLEGKVPPRWQPGAGWKNIDTHGFRSKKDKEEGWLNYQNIIVSRDKAGELPANREDLQPQRIDDFLDYNSSSGGHWVGDLMLECKLTVQEPTGEFALRLNRGMYQYQARWDLATGTCTLLRREHDNAKGWVQLASQPTSVKQGGSYQLRFANFDSRLTVWVDGSLPFGPGFDYSPPELPTAEEIKASEAKELDDVGLRNRLSMRCGEKEWDKTEPASIGVKDAAVEVHNLKLWRDTYYSIPNVDPAGDDVKVDQRQPNFVTMYVQPKHYLVLGDNSQSSADSRMWGLVPERLLLGRALAIYFPFDRAGAIR